jgi:hypothetical protein
VLRQLRLAAPASTWGGRRVALISALSAGREREAPHHVARLIGAAACSMVPPNPGRPTTRLLGRGSIVAQPHWRQSHWKKLAVAVVAAVALASCAGSAGAQEDCSWGASSITASYENGHIVESAPTTSGCT